MDINMKKIVNARTRAILRNCLNNPSNDEDNKVQDLLGTQVSTENDLVNNLHEDDVKATPNSAFSSKMSINNNYLSDRTTTQLAHASQVTSLKYQLLVPYNLVEGTANNKGLIESISNATLEASKSPVFYDNTLTETDAEKSIEPPPYSPLTPRLHIANNFNGVANSRLNSNPTLCRMSHDERLTKTSAEKSAEALFLGSPLSVSPIPLMSPETANIFNILADSITVTSVEGASDTSAIPDERSDDVAFLDSDDSVRDPNYYGDVDEYSSSDDISNHSISLISGTMHAEIHQIPRERYNIITNPPGIVCSDSHGGGNGFDDGIEAAIMSVNDDMPNVSSGIEASSVQPSDSLQTDRQSTGRPRKGRKRLHGGQSREERKRRKYMNLSYVNSRKKVVEPKSFIDFKCSCLKKCHEQIPVAKRLAEYNKFYSLDSYIAQNMYLAAVVRETPVKRQFVSNNKTNVSKMKTYSRQYLLNGTPVCRDMFVKTFQTTPKRINTSLCKMRSDKCIKDKRGAQAGHNTVDPESEQFVIRFIEKLPKYVSHYRREDCEGAKFLRADLTFSKLYELYCEETKVAGVKTLSYSKVHKIYLKKFNLRTKPLKKDTCNKCDYYESRKQNASEEDKAQIEQMQITHQEKAKALQNQMKTDMQLAKDDSSVETITFDLQKTLPLPRIPTNIVFYKRQLWVYNLGIHTGSNDEAHCNVWVEGEAGRGAQEVGSCLIKHVLERVGSNVKRLILWSDSCGGQNRNIKLVLMLKALLNEHPTIVQINMRFLESGHSFLPNDTDFGKIECALKVQQRIYTPDDYMQIMKLCKKHKPMHVHRMKTEEFLSSLKLEKNITNRKKTEAGEKVSWINTKEIMLKKDEMFKIFMRSDLCEEFKEVNIQKNDRSNRSRSRQSILTKEIMEPLWPNGKPVPEPKLKDLKSLLHLIPKDAHSFYLKLVGDENVEDDIEGFSGQPDFEVEDTNIIM